MQGSLSLCNQGAEFKNLLKDEFVMESIERWRETLEAKRFRMTKPEYMDCNFCKSMKRNYTLIHVDT